MTLRRDASPASPGRRPAIAGSSTSPSALHVSSVAIIIITADDTTCSLIDALTAANLDTPVGGCLAGSGADIIELMVDVALTTPVDFTDGANGLPSVTSVITLKGKGHTITGPGATGDHYFRLLHIAEGGDLTLNKVTLRDGVTVQTDALVETEADFGGAVFNRGTLTVARSTMARNIAVSGPALYNAGHAVINWTIIGPSNDAVSRDGIIS
jgi:hypothetical protein